MPSDQQRIVAITRVMDEEDIIEPFVRHHAAFVDAHILLDNGSTDRTLEILRGLAGEGLRLEVLSCPSPIFNEAAFNAVLLGGAVMTHAPDWVLTLDADEFVDARGAGGDLRGLLAAQPADIAALRVPLIGYRSPVEGTRDALNPVERIVRREAAPNETGKLFLRGRLAARNVSLTPGNHAVMLDGKAHYGAPQSGVVLAHFPTRSAEQRMLRALIGRLKVIAAGSADAAYSAHYENALRHLLDDPIGWLDGQGRHLEAQITAVHLVDDPLPYRGGPLRYTEPGNDRARFMALLIRYADLLARSHGRILDECPAAAQRMRQDAIRVSRLI